MKINTYIVLCALLSASTIVRAQDTYDVARLNGSDLNGTARFIGMGGAMGALGGDLTSMGVNPAGLGIYRSSDVAVTMGMNFLSNDLADKTNRVSFDQVGIAISTKYSNYSTLKYVNFGFNYRKKKNFFNSFGVNGYMGGDLSQTFQIAGLANEALDDGVTNINQLGALPSAAVHAGIITEHEMTDASGNPILDDKGNPMTEYHGIGATDTYYRSTQTGGISEYDFSIAANLNDQVFLGLSVGYYDVHFDRDVLYTEYGVDDCSYDMLNRYRTRGEGIDVKLGAIFRPIADSNFRFGFAIHTPTWYRLTDENSVDISLYDEGNNKLGDGYTDVPPVDYELTTPWKFNVNLGHTIGNVVAIGAEYEYEDYSSVKLREADGYESTYTDCINSATKDFLKGVSTVRIGVEVKPLPELSLRAGYNYSSAIFNKGAYRSLYYADVQTDTFTETSFANTFDTNRFTCGIGFRSKQLYADLAYQYTMQKSDFYEFDDEALSPASLDNKRHQLSLTVGYRF